MSNDIKWIVLDSDTVFFTKDINAFERKGRNITFWFNRGKRLTYECDSTDEAKSKMEIIINGLKERA